VATSENVSAMPDEERQTGPAEGLLGASEHERQHRKNARAQNGQDSANEREKVDGHSFAPSIEGPEPPMR
jgi:hypothetical protein